MKKSNSNSLFLSINAIYEVEIILILGSLLTLPNVYNCSKYISCEYSSKTDALMDKDVKSLACYKCGKESNILIPWFWSNPRLYCAIGRCNEHGLLDGKIRIKKKDCTNKIYVVKTISSTDEQGYEKIMARQNNIREKRREKRFRKKHQIRGFYC